MACTCSSSQPVSEVNTADVLEILTPIWHSKAETTRAVRQRIRSVLEWAIALDMRSDNPCDRVLTAARSAEVRLATWDEMDMAGRVWTISAERMKAKREHRVPLCGRALEILHAARALGDGSPLMFPMRSGRTIAMSTLPKMLQYHEIASVPHGFRSSFRDWAAEETDHPRAAVYP